MLSVFRQRLNVCKVLDSRIQVGSSVPQCRCGETEGSSAKICGMWRNTFSLSSANCTSWQQSTSAVYCRPAIIVLQHRRNVSEWLCTEQVFRVARSQLVTVE